jgi:hypothetical protein
MLSAVLANIAAACFFSMLIALSKGMDLAEECERLEYELEEERRKSAALKNGKRTHLFRVK